LDATGNRTNTGYTTGDNNQLLDDGTYDYEYDDEGNRTKKTHATSGDYVDYTWDHRNRLTTVTFRDSLDAKTKEVLYTYDVFDRLIRKQVDDNGNGTIDRAESFVYDGDNVVLVFDETSSLTNRYLHGSVIDQVFADETAVEVLWTLTDNAGNVRDVANYDPTLDTSSILNHREFDSFGNIRAESNSSIEFRYAYTGRYFDEDTGIQKNGERWYDPEIGRWISEDPIQTRSGDTNFNRYVGNSPTNFVDPTGLIADDYSPASFGLRGDGASWLLNQPREYAIYMRALMDWMNHRMLVLSNGASVYDDGNNGGNPFTSSVGWLYETTTGNDLAHSTDEQLRDWAVGASVVIGTGVTVLPALAIDAWVAFGPGATVAGASGAGTAAAPRIVQQLNAPAQRLAGQINTLARMRPLQDRIADFNASPSNWQLLVTSQ
jgi:RHS repeat-associated protein